MENLRLTYVGLVENGYKVLFPQIPGRGEYEQIYEKSDANDKIFSAMTPGQEFEAFDNTTNAPAQDSNSSKPAAETVTASAAPVTLGSADTAPSEPVFLCEKGGGAFQEGKRYRFVLEEVTG